MTYRNHPRPRQTTHHCSVKLAQQRANGEAGIYVSNPDPDAPLGFNFTPMHPDWKPPCTPRDADLT